MIEKKLDFKTDTRIILCIENDCKLFNCTAKKYGKFAVLKLLDD